MQFKGTGSMLVKDLDTKQGIVQAYWSAFGNKDEGGDIVQPGCWSKSIRERGPKSSQPRIKFLYQHDEKMVISKPIELVEDNHGLLATCQIPPTTLGKDVLILYEYGILTEHSVGYETVQSQWDVKNGARLLIECVCWEGSCVTWGMNADTPVVSVKSLAHPAYLTALAERAQKIDTLLHHSLIQSEPLCATFERELKALHAALAPADAGDQPYTIQGVMDTMTDLASRLQSKAATQDDKDAQEARSKKYSIGIKDGGNVTKPSADGDLPDSSYGDPVNYRYPMKDKAHADNAAARFGDAGNREQYTSAEQDIIAKRIMARQRAFDEDPDWWPIKDGGKAAPMKRMIKGTGGDIEVAEDGTHAKYTGSHKHSHKAYGAQGDDSMHDADVPHEHKGDASHDHHKAKTNPDETSASHHQHIRKARDFGTLFASLNESDQLQDDWGDTFIAFVQAMWELMCQSQYQQNGWIPDGMQLVDIPAAAQENLDAFGTAVMALVDRSVAASFVPAITHDMDQFIDPDGPNADDNDGMDDDYWKSHHPLEMPDAPAPQRKSGRAISGANRQVMTGALDGMTKAMGDMKMHHKAMTDLLEKTDPDHVRQDEDDTQGDDDTPNGGDNPQKSRFAPRRSATEAATTHQGHTPSALFAEMDALTSRMRPTGGKASQ